MRHFKNKMLVASITLILDLLLMIRAAKLGHFLGKFSCLFSLSLIYTFLVQLHWCYDYDPELSVKYKKNSAYTTQQKDEGFVA